MGFDSLLFLSSRQNMLTAVRIGINHVLRNNLPYENECECPIEDFELRFSATFFRWRVSRRDMIGKFSG